jgi:hypothetical protein
VADGNFYSSGGLLLMMRAGFLVHFHVARMKSISEQKEMIEILSEEVWALLRLFSDFVWVATRIAAEALVPRPLFRSAMAKPARVLR